MSELNSITFEEINDFNISFRRCWRGWVGERYNQQYSLPVNYLTVWWIIEGTVTVTTDDTTVTAQSGEVIVCKPGAPRYQRFSVQSSGPSYLTINPEI